MWTHLEKSVAMVGARAFHGPVVPVDQKRDPFRGFLGKQPLQFQRPANRMRYHSPLPCGLALSPPPSCKCALASHGHSCLV